MRKIDTIVVHCSASDVLDQMTVEAITHLHTSPSSEKIQWGEYPTEGRGWRYIGYHYVIQMFGGTKIGRPIDIPGAHVKGHNANSVGICLTGDKFFSQEQLDDLVSLVKSLQAKYHIPNDKVLGHYELDPVKTCPNINMHSIRSLLC